MVKLPKFSELPVFEETGEHYAWDVWGRSDEIGMVNLLAPERVQHAASLVRKGRVINVEPSKAIPPPRSPNKLVFEYHLNIGRTARSDYVDHWPFHGGWAHLDGLSHHRYREFGYYGGRQDEDLARTHEIGIDKWAQHGLVGRGVLIDVARYLDNHDQTPDPDKRFYIGTQLIEAAAAEQGVAFEPADIILLRTGWYRWYSGLTPAEKQTLDTTEGKTSQRDLDNIVLDRHMTTAEWLWDHQIVAVWADNGALESHSLGDPAEEGVGSNHRRMLVLMGIGIGEFFTFEELSEDCAQDGVYEFMVTAKPVNFPGAVGSSANAYVIK